MTPELHFEHHPTRPDGGGYVTVTATTTETKYQVFQHLRQDTSDLDTMVAVLSSPKPHTWRWERANRPWYQVSGTLPAKWTEPYLRAWLLRLGESHLPELSPEYTALHQGERRGLYHTRLVQALSLSGGLLNYTFLVESEDHMGELAADRAAVRAGDLAREWLGDTQINEEYVENSNGRLVRNPRYGGAPVHFPAMKCQMVWDALVDWWLANKATPAQCEVVAASKSDSFNGQSCLHRLEADGITPDWSKPKITWPEFQKLT